MKKTYSLAIVVAGMLAAACSEDVDSTDVRTSGVYADMEVLANGDGSATVTVGLRVGGSRSNTYLVMKGDDELVATADGADRELAKNRDTYRTTFGTEAGETAFVVAFNRGPDDEDAPNSSATLPEPFELADVAGPVSRAEDLVVTWTPSGTSDDMTWSLDGDCMFANGDDAADNGTLTLTASDYDLHTDAEAETCSVTLCLERTRAGQVDPAFGEGGSFVAIQRRCETFSSTP